MNYKSIGFFIGNEVICENVCKYIDGKAKYVLVDTESKQNFNLFSIAKKNISKSQVIPFKPNDVTVESVIYWSDIYLKKIFKGRKF